MRKAAAGMTSRPSQTSGLPKAPPASPKPATRGELDELSKARRRKKRVIPTASRFTAMPTTIWSAR